MAAKKTANLLSLAVLSLLREKPTHPYEISTLMRERGLSYSVKLNFGSLYATIAGLLVQGQIAVKNTEREGNLPERTIYAITPSGNAELQARLVELLNTPAKEYPRFTAALTMLGHLVPEQVTALLTQRTAALRANIARDTKIRADALGQGVEEFFLLEVEYSVALYQAELAWVEALIQRITGSFTRTADGVPRWKFLTEENSHEQH